MSEQKNPVMEVKLPEPDQTGPDRWICEAGNVELEMADDAYEATVWLRDQALAPDDAYELAISLLACWRRTQ